MAIIDKKILKKELSPEDLKTISGGAWNKDTIAPEDREEFEKILALLDDDAVTAEEFWSQYVPFAERMDAQYGPNSDKKRQQVLPDLSSWNV